MSIFLITYKLYYLVRVNRRYRS